MKHLLKRYFSYQGRTSRQQYGVRSLVFVSLTALIVLFVKVFSLDRWGLMFAFVWFPVWLLVISATGVRRCRDSGINPHWLWMWLFPVTGSVFYIALGCLKSDDGVRITRPTPKPRIAKKKLVRYLSIFGYATRQEYWCIAIPITLAIGITTSIAIVLFAFLASLFVAEPKNGVNIFFIFFTIFFFTASVAHFAVPAWLLITACVRRCRDAALNPWWSLLILPSWCFGLPVSSFVSIHTSTSPSWMSEDPLLLRMLENEIDNKFLPLYLLLLIPYIVFGILTSKELESKEKA